MSSLVELLGPKLLTKDGESDPASVLSGKKAIALYFSAHWCPPCQKFTPELSKWYTDSLQAKGLEIVFVSSDRDQASFDSYYSSMPWCALPFDNDKKDALDKKFKVQGIPTVVILDSEGNLLNKDGREAISGDPTGEDMPWKPKTMSEILDGAKILGKDGVEHTADVLSGKVFALYFSGHWCPPCRGFTPKLAEWYTTSLKDKGLEVVFVSSDKDQASFDEYYGEQPWLALDFSDRKRKDQLSSLLGVKGIPSVAIVGADGGIISKDGRAALSGDPTGENFPWYPKPVSNLKDGPGTIQEVPTVIAFCEACGAADASQAEESMNPIAAKFIADAKVDGEDEPKIGFAIVTKNEGIAPQVRKLMGLQALAPSQHEHPLIKQETTEGRWGCDGCGKSASSCSERHCCKQCDVDLCGDCNEASKAEPVVLPPRLMILDISDNGAYYEGPEGQVTEEMVAKLVADYQAKSLERKQLQK